MKKYLLTAFAFMVMLAASAQTNNTATPKNLPPGGDNTGSLSKDLPPSNKKEVITAQPPVLKPVKTNEQVAKEKTEELTTKLGLNAEQKKELYEQSLAFAKELDKLEPLKKSNPSEYEAKRIEKKKAYIKAFSAKLTPEQQAKMAELNKK